MGDTMMSPAGAITAKRVLFGLGATIITFVLGLFLAPYLLPGSIEKSLVRAALESVFNRPVQISGDASIAVLPSIHLTAKNIVISGDQITDHPELADIQRLDLELDTPALFSNVLSVKRLVIERPIVRLFYDEEGISNWSRSNEMSIPGVLIEPDFDWAWWRGLEIADIQFVDGRVVFDNRKSGRRIVGDKATFKARMSNETGAEDGLSLRGDIDVNGDTVNVRLDTGSLQRLITGGRLPVDLEVSSQAVNARYQGAMAKRQHFVTEGRVSVAVPDINHMEGWIGQIFSSPVDGGLNWSSNFSLNADRAVFKDMRLLMGRDEYYGSLVFDNRRNGTSLDGDIIATHLDATPLVSLVSDSMWFGGVSGRLRIAWGELSFGDLHFGKGGVTTTFEPARNRVILTVDGISTYGGIARGSAKIANREGMTSLDTRIEMSEVNAGPMLKGWNASTLLTGRSSIKLGLFSVGSTAPELLAALRGVGEFNVVQGAVYNPGLTEHINGEDLKTLDFSQLIGSFSIEKGIIRGRDLLLKSNDISLIGDGEVDLSRNHVDIHLQSLLRSRRDDQEGDLRVQPFHLRGDLADIQVFTDKS